MTSRRRRVDGVWDVERCVEICSAGESRQKSPKTFLIGALRFTRPCAVTSKPLACCGAMPAAAYCNMKARLEATAAIRRVRRIIAHGFRLAALRMGQGASARPSDRPAPQGQAREPDFAADFLFVTRPTRRSANGRHSGSIPCGKRSWTDRSVLGAFRFR